MKNKDSDIVFLKKKKKKVEISKMSINLIF